MPSTSMAQVSPTFGIPVSSTVFIVAGPVSAAPEGGIEAVIVNTPPASLVTTRLSFSTWAVYPSAALIRSARPESTWSKVSASVTSYAYSMSSTLTVQIPGSFGSPVHWAEAVVAMLASMSAVPESGMYGITDNPPPASLVTVRTSSSTWAVYPSTALIRSARPESTWSRVSSPLTR